MVLTNDCTGLTVLENELKIERTTPNDKIIAISGNPNVGKSTVFNNLTGLKQHTGNWPGKTIQNKQGKYKYKGNNFILVDIPGTYSLMSNSSDEEVARDFVCFGRPDATIVVVDSTCLERNLNLVLQTMEITKNVVVCVNLIDEAERKKIQIDISKLSRILGVPVIPTNARNGKGLSELMDAVYDISHNNIDIKPVKVTYDEIIEHSIKIIRPKISEITQDRINARWTALKLIDGDTSLIESINKYLNFNIFDNKELVDLIYQAKKQLEINKIYTEQLRDGVVSKIVLMSEDIANNVATFGNSRYNELDRKIDKIITSRILGIPIMILLLGGVFWLTITGANYPSQILANLLFFAEQRLTSFFVWINAPSWVHGILVLGVYKTLAWVISVMLPPMAIFFPLFALLEDLGYLPRVAFNLDNYFKKACAHGKQALTMCMGFGCNAAGVIGCRIIDSPREKLIAIITNNFVPCNGRFPTLIAIIIMFFAGVATGPFKSIFSAVFLTGIILMGIVFTLLISKLLSKTILKGLPSSFTLELPPYRKPQIGRILIRSILDRTLFVLGRAIIVAAPAGIVIWGMANIYISDLSILSHCAGFLDPFAKIIGMDGYILMAFILGFPANEIVLPIIIMSYMATDSMLELDSLEKLRELLVSHGWTWLTAICVMIFSLMHWPCGTTCLTIKKETQSLKWTLISIFIPTAIGIAICFIIANLARFLGMV